MRQKRIIPCLDIADNRVVKGTQFLHLKDAGDPVELGIYYAKEGADELVMLNISANAENQNEFLNLVKKTAAKVNIPLVVGGGIASVKDAEKLLKAGAYKVSINSRAIQCPELITELAQTFGKQKIVLAIDAKFTNDDWYVFIHGGKTNTKIKAAEWAKQGETLGAGEILLTSMEEDGSKNGFNLPLTKLVTEAVNIPVIASGGAGKKEDFLTVFEETKATGALAASIFHYNEVSIRSLKNYLTIHKISIEL